MRMENVWRIGVAALVVTAVMAPALSAQARRNDKKNDRSWSDDQNDGPKETETVDRTVSFPSNGTLRIRNFSGHVKVTGTSGTAIVLTAKRRAARPQLDHIKLDVQTSGSTVTIDANKRDDEWERSRHNNNVVETSMELLVPAAAHLDIDVFSSDVTIDDVRGDQHLKTFSGDLTVRGPKAGMDAETFSGDIHVEVEPGARGSVSFHTFSGDLKSSLSISSSSRRKRDIEGTLPAGGGPRLQFKTFSGDLAIKTR